VAGAARGGGAARLEAHRRPGQRRGLWLPGSAESTQVLDTSDKFRPEQIPAVVVYAREGGLTAQDKRRIAQDAQQIKGLTAHGVRGAETRGPVYDNASAPEAAQIYSSRRSCWSCC
jgi:hypothetical protein